MVDNSNSIPACHLFRQWRDGVGINQGEAGKIIGLSPSKVSEIESGKRPISVKVALAIEELSAGSINAADLNDTVRAARSAMTAQRDGNFQNPEVIERINVVERLISQRIVAKERGHKWTAKSDSMPNSAVHV